MYRIALVFLLLIFVNCDPKKQFDPSPHSHKSDSTTKEEIYYTCSMHPHVKEQKPGKCPICQMNLTKMVVEHDHSENTSEGPEKEPTTSLPRETIARVKLRKSQLDHFHPELFSATTMKMSKRLRVLGLVKSAEEKVSNIAARFPARVEKVFVESVGSQIKRGDPVVQVYSPELLTTGEELILSAKQSNQDEFSQLLKKAREKLVLWGIRPSQINRWIKNEKVPRNVTLFANSSGVVRKRNAVPGKYFKEGQNYFELSDLSQVWIEMDVYEHNSNLLNLGQSVSLRFVALPGKLKAGEIDFISPTINEKTRTLKVRTTITNEEGTLKPGMVAQGTISVTLEGNTIVVPTSAIIDTGVRKLVWIKDGNSTYRASLVTTGFQSEGYTEIVSGVKEGEQVVLEGSFLLDAQAQFFGGYEDFSPQHSGKHNH